MNVRENMANYVQEMQRKRFQFLQKLFDQTEGNELDSANLWQLGDELGFTYSETTGICNYLRVEGLIKNITHDGLIAITHRGIKEVETALSKPEESTTHFPALNYIHVEHMIGSQIQQGANQSSQVLTYNTKDIEAILKFVADLKSQLPELKLDSETEAEVDSDISTIESQVKSPRPKFTVIKECLLSIRTVLEGIAGNAIAAILLQQIGTLPK
jgi:hypothetical protein